MPTRLLLDCDTGTDDAIAIMAAVGHPELELLAVTTVNGNVALPNVTENTLRVLDHIGSTVPVYEGASRPLLRPDFPVPRHVLNADNPEFQKPYLDLPVAHSRARQSAAARFLVDFYLDDDHADVALVATGPLTNVALALELEPELSNRIPRLVVMGGATVGGNVTAAAEFNFWVDADAARLVLDSGIQEITVIPLDATHSVPLSVADCEMIEALGTPGAWATAKFIRHRIEHDNDGTNDSESGPDAPVHDPLCVAYLADPAVITDSRRYPVTVETAGERTLGEFVVDRRPWSSDVANATVALGADHDRYLGFLRHALKG